MNSLFRTQRNGQETHAVGYLRRHTVRTQGKNSLGRVFTAILFGFIMIFLFAGVLMGIQTYRSINSAGVSVNETRSSISFIANSISFSDAAHAVTVGQGPEGASLVLLENQGGTSYETRFYAFEGTVVQEYTVSGNPYTPQAAQVVVASHRFDFTIDGALITVWLDQGVSYNAIRSYQGGVR